MSENTFQKFAGSASFVVGLASIAYGLIFVLLIPDAQRGAAPAALTSYATNPVPVQVATLLLVLATLAASAVTVGIYRRLREKSPGWALWSLALGLTFSFFTTLDAIYTSIQFASLSNLYATGDTALKATAVALWNAPSPLNPYDVTEFIICGLWLFVTGLLMVRSGMFSRLLGYLATLSGLGLILLFIGTYTNTGALILIIGIPGSIIFGPLFWLWVGYTLWRGE